MPGQARPRPSPTSPDTGVVPGPPAEGVEIVVPVRNEAHVLAQNIGFLHRTASATIPWPWTITIADNGSTDDTPRIARRLADQLDRVSALEIDRSGRGRALRTAWSRSDAAVLAYMDVDLSTDLRALLPLVATVLSGHSDIAIGSRLLPASRVQRGIRRDVISRSYNGLLRTVFGTSIHDAQCGFKALSSAAFAQLAPDVQDDEWFFDTELLLLAERNHMRVTEVPVDWIDDPDSSVQILRTAAADLRGIVRVARSFTDSTWNVPNPPLRPGLGVPTWSAWSLVGALAAGRSALAATRARRP